MRLGNRDFRDFYIIVNRASPYGSMDPLGLEIIIVGDPQQSQHVDLGGLGVLKWGLDSERERTMETEGQ